MLVSKVLVRIYLSSYIVLPVLSCNRSVMLRLSKERRMELVLSYIRQIVNLQLILVKVET
jgi:hypothetical protein